eukprot:m.97096 g.97096  ORF g.97096 m.97096 type:complete len:55 (+) comp12385_c0_seq1:216-380(+)
MILCGRLSSHPKQQGWLISERIRSCGGCVAGTAVPLEDLLKTHLESVSRIVTNP